jgi:hypothetical protein
VKGRQCRKVANKEAVQQSSLVKRRLKPTAVIKEDRWTSGVASSQRKIYQLEEVQRPSGIIVISVVTIVSAVLNKE